MGHTGCDVKLPRKDIKAHVNDDFLGHVLKQTTLVMALTQENKILDAKLQSVMAELQLVKGEKQYLKQHLTEKIKTLEAGQQVASHTGQPIVPVEFTVTNFNQYRDGEQWYSPPFYTHPHGYKMCLCVTPKGWGKGKGTHLGVDIRMMRGEFDDQLKWPFRGNIIYQLMNQEKNKDHVVNTVDYNEGTGDHVAGRVTGRERSSVGRGQSEVLPLSELEPKYLENNCIKLCIARVVLSQ